MKKILRFIAVTSILCLLLTGINVFAATPKSYTINDGVEVPMPSPYDFVNSINVIKGMDNEKAYLKLPSDIFIFNNEYLFIADTGNNRILQTTLDGIFVSEFTEANGIKFKSPQGVFVTDENVIYIADTGNSRIVSIDKDGKFIYEYGKPKSSMLEDVSVYSPTKITVSKSGELYVLLGERIMKLDSSNDFRGFIGQTDIGFDFTEWLLRLVASDEQKQSMTKRTASTYYNFCLHEGKLLYAVSQDAKSQIKILNTVGNNIYRTNGGVSAGMANVWDNIINYFKGKVISKSYSYGQIVDRNNPVFNDICVNDKGIITVIQKQNGMLYQYDTNGQILAAFGGLGSQKGQFTNPVSIVTDNEGLIYVLDSSFGNIQVFAPTDFIISIQQAVIAYDNGEYDTSKELWNEVLDADETYPLALAGLGNACFKNNDWKGAMEYYKRYNDRGLYTKAFSKYVYEIFRENFAIVVISVVIIVLLLILLISKLSKSTKKLVSDFEYNRISNANLWHQLRLSFGMMFCPLRTINAIKYNRGKIKGYGAAIVLLVAFVTRLLFVFFVHYPMQDIELQNVDILLEFVKLILPVVTWIIASYLISSQFDGESTMLENFLAASYSMNPYIVLNLFATGLSQFISWDQRFLFGLIVNGATVIMIILFFISVLKLNDYSFGKTVIISLISVVAIAIIWVATLLGYTVVARFIRYIGDVIYEIRLL